MIPEERRSEILDKLRESKVCTLNNLTSEFNVSRVTIQRDINLLKERGLVRKVHGGAKFKKEGSASFETRFTVRLNQNYAEKLEIANKAITYVKESSIIFIDSSTTCYMFAKELFKKNYNDLNIVTISPTILYEALKYPDLRIISTGGKLRQDFNMLYGKWVIDFLKKINIDSAFISAAGVSIKGGITSSDTELINILNVVFAKSEEVNLLMDSTKFSKAGMLNINPIDNCKRIITDKKIDKKVISDFKKKGNVELVY